MKLLLIRHGDPDYEHDSLTEKGWREAACLAERMAKLEIADFYVSPLGRAKDTASLTLKKMGREATVCDWLREFQAPIWRPDRTDRKMIPWDWLPQDWTTDERFFDPERWSEHPVMAEGQVRREYDRVTGALDAALAEHGLIREGRHYRVERETEDTLAFFCHFGVSSVLLSHLLSVSPMVLWHGFCAAPSSVTTVVTEERRKGIAFFRTLAFGDISHLYIHGEPPAFSARFCEVFSSTDQRHD